MRVCTNRHHERHRRIGAHSAGQNVSDHASKDCGRDHNRGSLHYRWGSSLVRGWCFGPVALFGGRTSCDHEKRRTEDSEGSAAKCHAFTVVLIDNDCQH